MEQELTSRVAASQGGSVYSPLRVHVQEGANNQGQLGFDDEQVTGHSWVQMAQIFKQDPPPGAHPWQSLPHSTLFPLVDPPQVLTANIVQTDDDSHHYFPSRSKSSLSQLLIGSDAWESGGRKE